MITVYLLPTQRVRSNVLFDDAVNCYDYMASVRDKRIRNEY